MSQATITLEHSVLVIDYITKPKASDESVYKSPPDKLFDCDVEIKKGRLYTSAGMIGLTPYDLRKLTKELQNLTKPIAIKAEELRI